MSELSYGVEAPEIVNVVIENPKGSQLKVEFDKETGYFMLDRVHQTHLSSPCEYGFIPDTLDEDGDALDVLLVSDYQMTMGMVVPMRVIGVMYMVDNGEVDNKLIGVPAGDDSQEHIQKVADLGENWQHAVKHYFEHYKDLKGGGEPVTVGGFADFDEAAQVFYECVERAKQG